ncbi:hypothetical protein DW223_13705 [Butyricicoccus sp. AM18-35]|nr:hypothetical protein [Butyricicoccus sp. AM18-35]RHO13289.1 hypothetical protein DW223_13705 [Butyricicoccus sp. AM18-35]
MGLKNLLRRASGLITAFALLASMVVSVAGAVDPTVPNPDGPDESENLKNKITLICHNCSSPEGSSHSHVFSRQSLTPVSVESVYGVHDIDGMTTLYQVGNEYWLFDMPSSSSDSCIGYCPYKIKDVLTAEGLIDSTKSVDPTTGSASVPVNVTREAATFSVTVPTTLPISVDADGNVTTATDATIINNSSAPVAVTKVELASLSDWTLAAYSRDILNLPVDTRQFGLQMNIGDKTIATSNSGTSDILSDSLNARIAKGQNCAVTYNALFPAQTATVSDTQIANVVFTVSWA